MNYIFEMISERTTKVSLIYHICRLHNIPLRAAGVSSPAGAQGETSCILSSYYKFVVSLEDSSVKINN